MTNLLDLEVPVNPGLSQEPQSPKPERWTNHCFFPHLSSARCLVFEVIETSKDLTVMENRVTKIRNFLKTLHQHFELQGQEGTNTKQLRVHVLILFKATLKNGQRFDNKLQTEEFHRILSEKVEKSEKLVISLSKISIAGNENSLSQDDVNKIRELIHPELMTEQSEKKFPLRSVVKFITSLPPEYNFQFSSTRFSTDLGEESFRLNREGILTFIEAYSVLSKTSIKYLPPLSSLKSSKLFQTDPIDGGIWDSKANKHVGELEIFLREVDFWVEKDASGLLLHGFSTQSLASILECDLFMHFEFDWLLFSQSRLFMIEVTCCPEHKHLDKNIQSKLNQIFCGHVPAIQLIIWYFIEHIRKTDQFSEIEDDCFLHFMKRQFSVVVFMAGPSSQDLHDSLVKVINNPSALKFKIEEVSDVLLQSIYFVAENAKASAESCSFLRVARNENGRLTVFPCQASPLKATENDQVGSERNLSQLIAGMFALGIMCKDGTKVLQFEEGLSLDEKAIAQQNAHVKKRKRNDDEPHGAMNKKPRLNRAFLSDETIEVAEDLKFVLSPQQFTLINSSERKLVLVGETGTGKTVLLLAKALLELRLRHVDTVYFCIPESRQKTKEFVQNLTKQESNAKYFHQDGSFHIVSDSFLPELFGKPLSELKRTMLLVDEYYCDYEESFKSPQTIIKLREQVFPHLGFCWVVDVVVRKISQSFSKPDQTSSSKFESYSKISDYFPLEMFTLQTLNVQFRCAQHIATFCSAFHHRGKIKGFTSAKTDGTDISDQKQCVLQTFKLKSDICLKTVAQNVLRKDKQERWAIVFCNESQKNNWEIMLHYKTEGGKSLFGDNIFTVSWDANPSFCNFSGAEAYSVVVFLDSLSEKAGTDNIIEEMLKIALSRAQYELYIFVHESLENSFELLQKSLKGDFEILQTSKLGTKATSIDHLKHRAYQLVMDKTLDENLRKREFQKELKKNQLAKSAPEKVEKFLIAQRNSKFFALIGRKFGINLKDAILDYVWFFLKN